MTSSISAICAAFHREDVEHMLECAQEEALSHDLEIASVMWVAGTLEIPLMVDRELEKEDTAGAICLGVIEKGETDHGLVIGQAVMKTLVELQLIHDKPIGVGIIGPGAEVHHLGPRLEPHARNAVRALLTFFDGGS